MIRRFAAPTAGLVALLSLAISAPAQDPAKEGPAQAGEKEGWLPVLQKHAKGYEIAVDGPEGLATSAMRPDPLMRWTQPVRGGDDGVLCLWTERGRPVAALTIFTFKGDDGLRNVVHEHQSLSTHPLQATWQGRPLWHTEGPGLTFAPVPEAPVPADTPAARLRQMQALTRDFSANTIDNKESTWPLRVLARPLYRYEGTGPDVIDGGLFALVQGNDPEAFLLLEARVEGGKATWHYAAARLTDLRLRVRLKGREIHSVPYTVGTDDGPYQTKIIVSKASDKPADFEKP